MQRKNPENTGFTLLEIMVTVAIMAIMAGAVSIGFSSFGESVRARETAGVITDIVKSLELEAIRKEYASSTVHFEEDYLVVESQVEGGNSSLVWKGMGAGSCSSKEGTLHITNPSASDPINLAKRDEYGNNIEVQNYASSADQDICISFQDSEETEWQYQAFYGSDTSAVVRFIHFNIRRDGSSDVKITSGNNYTLKIEAPYAKKTFSPDDHPVQLELTGSGGETETVTLQE